MKGIHHIIVQNRYLKYEFDIKRNITVLLGDSATGKTTLIEMIQERLINGQDSGVTISCDVPCVVLTGELWKNQLKDTANSIVFIDEGYRFVRTEEFALAVRESSNYYVIVSRESLDMLPISVDEIYGIKSSGKYGSIEPVYHELYKIYTVSEARQLPVKFQAMLVEDSNSGYEFFSSVADDKGYTCYSAHGKSRIYNTICNLDRNHESLLIIADGAAFGSQMNRLYHIIRQDEKIQLYLPESFEWLLLNANLFKDSNVSEILSNPSDYIDSKDYFSWERFFTKLLIDVSQETYLKYDKSSLNQNYLNNAIKTKVLDSIKGIEF
ncbi:MAG TPA: translation initiation factor 2 [Eubacterium sp.]|nr:translation initiation factor 2 [Eubacterium sp.]